MIKKLAKHITILLGSLIILIAILTSTEMGLRLMLKLIPGEVHAEKISGSLLSGWNINQLTYKNKNTQVQAQELKINWHLGALLHKNFVIESLELNNAKINLSLIEKNNTKNTNTPFSLPKIDLPIDINIHQVNLSQVTININSKTKHNSLETTHQYNINKFLLSADIQHNQLSINQLLLRTPELSFINYGTINLNSWKNIQLKNQLTYFYDNKTIKLIFSIKNQNNNLILTANTKDKHLINSKINLSNYLSSPENMSIDANWSIQAIHKIINNFNIDGEINSTGKIAGKLLAPNITVNLTAKNASYGNININQLNAKLKTKLSQNKPIEFKLNGKNIAINNKVIENIENKITGTLDKHNIHLAIKTIENRSLNIKAQGSLNNNLTQWNGYLQSMNIKLSNNPLWQLVKKTPVSLGKKNILLNNFCLTNKAGNICIDIDKKNTDINSTLAIKNLDLSILELWLDKDTKINGKLNTTLSANYKTNLQQASFNLAASAVNTIISNKIAHQTITQTFPSIKLNSKLNKNNGLASSLNINLPKKDYLNMSFSMPEYTGKGMPEKSEKIKGDLDINITHLDIIKAFTDSIEKIKGTISSDLQLNGTIDQPLLTGGLYLTNGKAKITPLGIKLNPIKLAITPKNNKSLEYKVLLGQKNKAKPEQANQLTLTGSTDLNNKNNFKTNININSDNFLASNTGEYVITIAPNLNITYSTKLTSINGELNIPSANIAPIDFSSTVTLPSDVVYVNNANIPINSSAKNLNLLLDIAVKLNNINFKYKGLNANLEGQLAINKKSKTELNTTGAVKINHGSYQAYGQDLTLAENSRLIFNGNASNPQLNLSAYKEVAPGSGDISLPSYQDKLIVGIKVTGTADKPLINFYSVPAGISQQNILSYIVFGFPQEQLSDSQTTAIWQALSMIDPSGGASGLTSFKNKIKQSLGITEFGFSNTSVYNPETEEVESGTSFVVGKRITDRLSLTYNMGIAVPINVLYLKYKLSSKWTAQTDSSSLGNGADIFYIIQRN